MGDIPLHSPTPRQHAGNPLMALSAHPTNGLHRKGSSSAFDHTLSGLQQGLGNYQSFSTGSHRQHLQLHPHLQHQHGASIQQTPAPSSMPMSSAAKSANRANHPNAPFERASVDLLTQQLAGTSLSTSKQAVSRRTGVVKFFNSTKGFGFIWDNRSTEIGDVDIFVHWTTIQGDASFKSLAEGEVVEYELGRGPKGLQAINVTGPNRTNVQGDPLARLPLSLGSRARLLPAGRYGQMSIPLSLALPAYAQHHAAQLDAAYAAGLLGQARYSSPHPAAAAAAAAYAHVLPRPAAASAGLNAFPPSIAPYTHPSMLTPQDVGYGGYLPAVPQSRYAAPGPPSYPEDRPNANGQEYPVSRGEEPGGLTVTKPARTQPAPIGSPINASFNGASSHRSGGHSPFGSSLSTLSNPSIHQVHQGSVPAASSLVRDPSTADSDLSLFGPASWGRDRR